MCSSFHGPFQICVIRQHRPPIQNGYVTEMFLGVYYNFVLHHNELKSELHLYDNG